jgi:hypothetical protein
MTFSSSSKLYSLLFLTCIKPLHDKHFIEELQKLNQSARYNLSPVKQQDQQEIEQTIKARNILNTLITEQQ